MFFYPVVEEPEDADAVLVPGEDGELVVVWRFVLSTGVSSS